MEADDEWLPNKLKKQVELFKKLPKEIGIVYTGYLVSLNGKIISKLMPKFKGDCQDYLLRFNVLATNTALVRCSCFEKVGLFEYMPSIEDWDMWMRMSEYYKFEYVPEVGYRYYGWLPTGNVVLQNNEDIVKLLKELIEECILSVIRKTELG